MTNFKKGTLYQRTIPKGEKTWCRNGTYTLQEYDDGSLYMRDTYFGDYSIKVTEENEKDFKPVMIFDDVLQVVFDNYNEYNEKDRFHYPTDSGGQQYAKYFVLKNAKPSREKKKAMLLDKIEYYKRSIEFTEGELFRLDKNEYYS